MSKKIDWARMGDLVCSILTAIYVSKPQQFRKEANQRGMTVEQLAAAAITGMIEERMEQPDVSGFRKHSPRKRILPFKKR